MVFFVLFIRSSFLIIIPTNSESSICQVRATVLLYDDINKHWVPAGSDSPSIPLSRSIITQRPTPSEWWVVNCRSTKCQRYDQQEKEHLGREGQAIAACAPPALSSPPVPSTPLAPPPTPPPPSGLRVVSL
uniref:WH1 domain-containing protein n=1 Tax=Amphiprion percula TaxID=161767 RepID=A0A3P8SZ96_AMPPE